MINGERNIKVTIDDSVLRKLIQSIDEAANKILKHKSFSLSEQNSSAGILDTANGSFGNYIKPVNKENYIENKKLEELTKKMLGDFEGMLANTQKMLQTVGMIDDEIGKIFQMIIQMVNSLSKGIDLGKSIFGFISNLIFPGSGGAAGGILGGGNNIINILSSATGKTVYPKSYNSGNTVYVIPKETVIRGRDIYTTWAIEEKINSSAAL